MSDQPLPLAHGACLCGAVGYEVERPFKFLVHDHCTICRRAAGAAFVTWAGVEAARFRVVRGAELLSRYQHTEQSTREFCSRCGSQLTFRSTRWAGEVHFTFATLIDPLPTDRATAHVFFSDRATWLDGHEALPRRGGVSGTEPIE